MMAVGATDWLHANTNLCEEPALSEHSRRCQLLALDSRDCVFKAILESLPDGIRKKLLLPGTDGEQRALMLFAPLWCWQPLGPFVLWRREQQQVILDVGPSPHLFALTRECQALWQHKADRAAKILGKLHVRFQDLFAHLGVAALPETV